MGGSAWAERDHQVSAPVPMDVTKLALAEQQKAQGNGVKVLAGADSTQATSVPVTNLGPSGFFRIAAVAPNPFNLP